jgi:hypothetical protein
MSRSRTVVIAVLSAWTLLLLVTHRGSRSPYSYIPGMTGTVDRVVNNDAFLASLPVTRFFYDGSMLADWSRADNMKLPFHSFAAATTGAFVRPYLLANDVANFLFVFVLIVAAVRYGAAIGLSDRAMLLAFATALALPAFVVYLGQPLHYIVGPIVNYLVVLTAMALPERDLRNPWIAGALTAILTLNYDWYVFGAALIVYVLAVLRFESKRDDLIYLAVSIAPVAIWRAFIDWVTQGTTSTIVRDAFIHTVIVQWADFFAAPAQNILTPFLAGHVGLHIGMHQVLALIYWPALLVGAVAAWRSGVRTSRLVWLLVIFFALEQIVTAAYDVENNPRRAFPIVFAFACLYSQVVDRRRRAWTAAFLAVFAITAFLAFADVALGKPGASYLQIGEAMHTGAKQPLAYTRSELHIGPPIDPRQAAIATLTLPAARIDHAVAFTFAQLFVGGWLLALFVLLRRAALLPPFAPAAFVAIWLLSAARFL